MIDCFIAFDCLSMVPPPTGSILKQAHKMFAVIFFNLVLSYTSASPHDPYNGVYGYTGILLPHYFIMKILMGKYAKKENLKDISRRSVWKTDKRQAKVEKS